MIAQQLDIQAILQQQRQFFNTGKTKDVGFRIAQLKKLNQVIKDHEILIIEALKTDLNKAICESYTTEFIVVYQEITQSIKYIKSWAKPKKVSTPIVQFPSKARIYPEPLGIVLIIGTWNYPLQLTISPLVGAIAAGNCAILKPSELAPNTSSTIAQIIEKNFDPAYIAVVEGGVETSQELLQEKFDHIFFTGGTTVGKIVMEAAAKNLTSVTLELGGKTPCIVDTDINIEYAARRITWGKFINAGQTCVAPDYLLVNKNIKQELLFKMKNCLLEFYGDEPAKSPDYARIIHKKQFNQIGRAHV